MSSQGNKNPKVRIVLDAMGGDFHPLNELLGADMVNREYGDVIEIVYAGDKEKLLQICKEKQISINPGNILHADQIVTMEDSPIKALKEKPNSSLVIGTSAVGRGEGDAFVSTGNTGAVVTASIFNIGRIDGVERPTIGTYFPNMSGVCTIFDVGAFVESKPHHLLSFARMSDIYVRELYGIERPTIGLLTVGEETEKGGALIKETHKLLTQSGLNFHGNIEGRDILKGVVNIVLCDGFTGNIVLKFGESFPKFMKHMLKEYAEKSFLNKLRVAMVRGVLKEALLPLDYQAYGGVPLLGVKKVSIIGHGSSTPLAIKNMILRAYEMHRKNLPSKIGAAISQP